MADKEKEKQQQKPVAKQQQKPAAKQPKPGQKGQAAEQKAHVEAVVEKPAEPPRLKKRYFDEVVPAMMDERNALVRYAKPGEIADAVAFFAGDASRFVHGQVLRVDGGMTLYAG